LSRTVYIAISDASRFHSRRLLGLTVLGRLLNEAARNGYNRAVLAKSAAAPLPVQALAEAPRNLEVVVEEVESLTSADLLPARLYGARDATILDASSVFAGGRLDGSGMVPIRDAASLRKAKWILLNRLRKPMLVDGVVGYYFMRPITLRITSLIANLPIRPNHVTLFCMALGVAGAVMVGVAQSVLLMQLGILLYFAGATLDCVDGELARVKHQGSYLGAWLDTLSDDVSTSLMVAAMGIYLTNLTGNSFHQTLGLAGAGCFLFGQLYQYYFLHTVFKSGDVLDFVWGFQEGSKEVRDEGFTDYLTLVLKRDFISAFLVICSLTGLLGFGASVVAGICVCYTAFVFHDWFFYRRKVGKTVQAQR